MKRMDFLWLGDEGEGLQFCPQIRADGEKLQTCRRLAIRAFPSLVRSFLGLSSLI